MAELEGLADTTATEQAEAPATQEASDTGSESQPEETVDWEARALASEGKLDSLQHNFDSLKGQTLKDAELRAAIAATQDGQSALNKKVNLLVEAQGTQVDGLAEKAEAIDGESAQAQEVRTLNERGKKYLKEITTSLEESGLESTDPGYQEVTGLWNEAREAAQGGTSSNRVLTLMSDAEHKANLLAKAALRAQLAEAKKATKAERRKVEEETGAFDLDTGPGSGGGEKNFEKIRDAYIADPYDEKISKAYFESRKAQGL